VIGYNSSADQPLVQSGGGLFVKHVSGNYRFARK